MNILLVDLRFILLCIGICLMANSGLALAQSNKAADLFKSPALAPLIKYLRCEGDTLNQYGESQPPLDLLTQLPEKYLNGEGIPVELWRGTKADLKMFAGFGSLSVWQHYLLQDKQALLNAMTAEGWKFSRVAINSEGEPSSSIINSLIAMHSAVRPIPGQPNRTRTLVVTEAKFGLIPDEIDLNGLTVTCKYSEPDSARGKR